MPSCLANSCGADRLDFPLGRKQALSDPASDNLWRTGANVCFRSGVCRLFHPQAPRQVQLLAEARTASDAQYVTKYSFPNCFFSLICHSTIVTFVKNETRPTSLLMIISFLDGCKTILNMCCLCFLCFIWPILGFFIADFPQLGCLCGPAVSL